MTSLKQDAKDIGLALAYDLMLVFLIVLWIIAIVLALLEISMWIVLGLFLVGCGMFFALLYFSKKHEEKEQKTAVTTDETPPNE
ncbi:MAG: hypothetical protein FK734_07810 [Asgard group archaeon]|nr:hypothetical protein [Asgard group archaeon]